MRQIAEDGTALTDAVLDALAEEYENGTWHRHGAIRPGRPRLYDEELTTVSFRIPKSRLEAIERAAKENGESKSEFFRRAIDMALASSV